VQNAEQTQKAIGPSGAHSLTYLFDWCKGLLHSTKDGQSGFVCLYHLFWFQKMVRVC